MSAVALGQEGWLYRIVLLLHIIAAIVGFGGVVLNGLYAAQSQQRPGPSGRAVSEANYSVAMVAEKFVYAVPVLGIALVLLSDGAFSFGTTWVWLSLVLYVLALGLSHSVMIPGHRRLNALLLEMEQQAPPAGGPPPQVAQIGAIGKKLAGVSMVLNLALVVMLALMIWKPGS
ncbi:MAG: putative integral rane protein [Actinomycetota bacterium]|jgi:uncharacterized membrane protein